MMNKSPSNKIKRGQFNTKRSGWLKNHVLDFFKKYKINQIVDPFAGTGDILKILDEYFPDIEKTGYDIDPKFEMPLNDSLIQIPKIDGIIVTNPPYLAKHSAKRKSILEQVNHYYDISKKNDFYQIAIDNCKKACTKGIFILPESLINSDYDKTGFVSITIILDEIFDDTDNPVCVVCYDEDFLGSSSVYIGDEFVGNLEELQSYRLFPTHKIPMKFNAPNGNIGLRAIDMTCSNKRIEFFPINELSYDISKIQTSSRLITGIFIEIDNSYIRKICNSANKLLEEIRKNSYDIVLTPFKGNNKEGKRRRRLDYSLARAILEKSV